MPNKIATRLLTEVEGSRSAPINPNTCRDAIAEIIRLDEAHTVMLAALQSAINWYTPPNDSGPFPLQQLVDATTAANRR